MNANNVTRGTKQNKVVNAAKERLRQHPWFRGVCTDNLLDENSINDDTFETAVDKLVSDTIYFDGPMPQP